MRPACCALPAVLCMLLNMHELRLELQRHEVPMDRNAARRKPSDIQQLAQAGSCTAELTQAQMSLCPMAVALHTEHMSAADASTARSAGTSAQDAARQVRCSSRLRLACVLQGLCRLSSWTCRDDLLSAQAQVQTGLQTAVLRGQQELLHDGALPAKVRELHERQTALAVQLQVGHCLCCVLLALYSTRGTLQLSSPHV